MKIYVVASRASKEGVRKAQEIADYLEAINYEVNRALIERSFEDEHKDLVSNYKSHMKSVRDADILICEVTAYSPGVGFVIATALQQGKAVLALYDSTSVVMPSNLLRGIESKKFQFSEYFDKDEMLNFARVAIKDLKKGLDKRFILTIQPDIDKYLDWANKEKGINKAELVRRSLRGTISKDKEYQGLIT